MNFWHQIRRTRYSTVSQIVQRPYVLQYFPPKSTPTGGELRTLRSRVSLSKIGRSSESFYDGFDSVTFGPEIHLRLKPIEALLSAGENKQALEKCVGDYTRFLANLPNFVQQYFFHCAISLFTYVWDFKSAIAITNLMIGRGLDIPPYTVMALLRQRACHNPSHIHQVLQLFWTDHVILDGKAVETMMVMMVSNNWRAESIDEFFTTYRAAIKPSVPSRQMVSTLIQAYATTGNEAKAERILDTYRSSNEWWPPNNSSPTSHGFSALESLAQNLPCDAPSDEAILVSIKQKMIPTTENDILSCPPFTSLLRGYCLSKVPLYPEVNLLLSKMDIDHVIPDAYFCNALLDTYSRWLAYSNALSVYNAMIYSAVLPLPDGVMYRKLAVLMRKAHEESGQTLPFFLSPRSLFRQFMLIHSHQVRRTRDSAGIASLETQNAFLSTFVRFKDYAGAMLILRLFSDFRLSSSEGTRVAVEINLLNRVQKDRVTGELEWQNKFLEKGRGFNYQIQHFRRYARPLKPLPASKEKLWILHEILGRALLAELGYGVKWARGSENPDTIPEEKRMQVETFLLDAMKEMMPSPDLEEKSLEANVNIMQAGITS